MEAQSFVLCDNLVKIYKVADLEVVALQGLDLELKQGEMMALVGPFGAGKSTLLNVIGGLDTPSAGEVLVSGQPMSFPIRILRAASVSAPTGVTSPSAP